MSKLLVATLVMMLLASSIVLGSNTATMDCGGACKERCGSSSRPNLCERACGTCCAMCNCVPPGTSGNYNVCPCYATMITRNGAHKCP